MYSPLANFAKVDEDAPTAKRKSVLVMSLSINSFQSFLYDTLTTVYLNEFAVYYTIFMLGYANAKFGFLNMTFG